MKPLWLFCALLAACASETKAPVPGPGPDEPEKERFAAGWHSDLGFTSAVLGTTLRYAVWLPDDYATATDRTYGVVYLLHGWGDEPAAWGPDGLDIGSLARAAAEALIYVVPQGFDSYYCNRSDGSFDYMDMFVEELVPHIDRRFRTTAQAAQRAVCGYSMGGFGALALASLRPGTFGTCIALSPSLNTDAQYAALSDDGWNAQWGRIFGGEGTHGAARLTDYYRAHCPLHFFAVRPAAEFAGVRYFIDCGDDEERLSVGSGALHAVMRRAGIPHEYRVRNGAHTEGYWRTAMPEVLAFVGHAFAGRDYPAETPIRYASGASARLQRLETAGARIECYLPDAYDEEPDLRYKVLYVSLGEGGAGLTTADVAEALDSLMDRRLFLVAGVCAGEGSGAGFEAIRGAVDAAFRTAEGSAGRLALLYGTGGEWLFRACCGSDRAVDYLYATDAALPASLAGLAARFCFVGTTDGATHYDDAQRLYEACREAGIDHELRVRNGLDTRASALSDIYSMSYFLGQFMTRRP